MGFNGTQCDWISFGATLIGGIGGGLVGGLVAYRIARMSIEEQKEIDEFEIVKENFHTLASSLLDDFCNLERTEESKNIIAQYKSDLDFFSKYNLSLLEEIDEKLEIFLYDN